MYSGFCSSVSFAANLPSALRYILVGAHRIRRLGSVGSCLIPEISTGTHAVRSKMFRLGGGTSARNEKTREMDDSPIMHTL